MEYINNTKNPLFSSSLIHVNKNVQNMNNLLYLFKHVAEKLYTKNGFMKYFNKFSFKFTTSK